MMDILNRIAENEPEILIPIIAIVLGCSFGIIAVAFTMIRDMVRSRDLERSRREIAAYIAEGSMSPDEGERILKAGLQGKKC